MLPLTCDPRLWEHIGVSRGGIRIPIFRRDDDCQFIADRAAIDAAIEEFFYNPHLDVLCLAYNAENGFAISQNLMITSDTQTMSSYILKAPAIAPVLDSVRFSVDNLSRGGAGYDYAIDRV